MEEIWKDIVETNCRYSISNLGRVKKNYEIITRSNGRRQTINEKIITPIPNNRGYTKVRCYVSGKVRNIYIHKLVARYFIPNLENKPQVNHINGIKTDNRVENLEWVTSKENIQHAWLNNLSKPTNEVKFNLGGVSFKSINQASSLLKVSRELIRRYINNQGTSRVLKEKVVIY